MISPRELLGPLVAVAVPLASFVTGLRSADPFWLWRRPRLLARSLLAILVVVPIVEVVLVELISPSAIVRAGITISILSVGVGPPNLMKRMKESREVARYEVGLNVTLMLASVLYLPLAVAIHGAAYHHELSLGWSRVALVVLRQALLPFVAGAAVARWLPKLASPLDRHGPRVVVVAILIVVVVALLATWRNLLDLGAAGWLTCTIAAMFAILIGHLAGGPAHETRTVLALFSAMRFPALAVLLASIVPSGAKLIPVVLAYIISSAAMVAVYSMSDVRGRRRARAGTNPARS